MPWMCALYSINSPEKCPSLFFFFRISRCKEDSPFDSHLVDLQAVGVTCIKFLFFVRVCVCVQFRSTSFVSSWLSFFFYFPILAIDRRRPYVNVSIFFSININRRYLFIFHEWDTPRCIHETSAKKWHVYLPVFSFYWTKSKQVERDLFQNKHWIFWAFTDWINSFGDGSSLSFFHRT